MVSSSARLPYVFEEPLLTDRLALRMMTPADVDAVYAYQSRADVCRYLLFEPRSREVVAEKVGEYARAVRLAEVEDYLQLALEPREAPGQVIGDSYFRIASVEHAQGEIGWTMHPDHTGRGYATEAAVAVLDLAFTGLGLHRVFAGLDVRNDASIAVCRRLGMRPEAHFVQDMWLQGEWSDTGIYALLADEWLARRVAPEVAGPPDPVAPSLDGDAGDN